MTTDDQDATLYPFTPAPPPPARSRSRRRHLKTAAGLALILGAGGGGAAALVIATGSTSGAATTATTTTVPGPVAPWGGARQFFARGGPASKAAGGFAGGGPGGQAPGGFAMRARMGTGPGDIVGMNGVIHGSYTLKGPNGTYETIDTQSGTAKDVTSSSITVLSADGFSQIYAVGSSTVVDADYNGIGSVAVGDNISIVGLASGGTVTAERVTDLTQIQANRSSWAPARPTTTTTTPTTSTTA